jgi:hypothetical protein
VFREAVPVSWKLFLAEGPQLPWFRVLRMTSAAGNPWLGTAMVPAIILSGVMMVAAFIWWYGARLEADSASSTREVVGDLHRAVF